MRSHSAIALKRRTFLGQRVRTQSALARRQNRTSLQYRMSGGLKLPPQPNRFEIGLVANSVRRVPHDHWPHTPRGPIVDRGIGD